MSIWQKKMVRMRNGKTRPTYLRCELTENNKLKPVMVAKTNIPSNIYKLLQTQDSVDDTNIVFEKPWRECVFCGKEASKSRFVQLQTIDLCNEHYLNKNIGKIVQRLNEMKEKVHA